MKKTFFALVLALLLPLNAFAGQVTVAAAANLQFVLEELKTGFEKDSGITLVTVIGSSGKLTSQVENGAPFDVFLSADTQFPDRLEKEGLTYRPPRIYAYGTLVLWTLKENIDLSKGPALIADAAIRKVAVSNPKNAPYGRQSVNAIKYYGLYKEAEKKLVYGESISQTNQFITTRAADIGFTAKSIVLAPGLKEKGTWVEVDPKAYEPIAQGAVVLKYAVKHNLKYSEDFFNFIFSPKAGEIFKKYGYVLPQE